MLSIYSQDFHVISNNSHYVRQYISIKTNNLRRSNEVISDIDNLNLEDMDDLNLEDMEQEIENSKFNEDLISKLNSVKVCRSSCKLILRKKEKELENMENRREKLHIVIKKMYKNYLTTQSNLNLTKKSIEKLNAEMQVDTGTKYIQNMSLLESLAQIKALPKTSSAVRLAAKELEKNRILQKAVTAKIQNYK